MGRPPCCDKVGIKKGPWTPEEDIILVSYIQEHGPGNWRSVPTNTGLLRCSKSCRLRWTNYLRPGIKRGNFTPHEEGMIIHLQALLGNKWAAIASYLPQRTDNDIKNYWNTHLKKKLKKFQSALEPNITAQDSSTSTNFGSKIFNERSRNSLDLSPNASSALKLYQTSTSSTNTTNTNTNSTNAPYASSAENISRLLEGWMRTSPNKPNNSMTPSMSSVHDHFYRPKVDQENGVDGGVNSAGGGGDMISHEEFESILSFENMNNVAWEQHKSTCEEKENNSNKKVMNKSNDQNGNNSNNPPLSFLEKWLLDESGAAGHVEEDESMQLSLIF